MVLSSVLLAACGEKGAEELVSSANSYLQKGESKAAIIQLKQALSQKANFAEARFLLGKVLLETGDPASAIVELRKAKQLAYSMDGVAPLLAKALLATQQYQSVVDEFAGTELVAPQAFADLKTTVATAYALLNRPADARNAIQSVLAKVPDYPAALLLQARMAGFERRVDDAMALMDKVLALTPKDPQAWMQKGELLLLLKQDSEGAMEAFRTALTIQPAHAGARAALISTQIGRRDFKAAREQLAELRKLSPNHAQTRFFEAQLAFADGDLKKALSLIELAQKAAPDDAQVLQVAGTIQLANGSLLQAERSFGRVLTLKPEQASARRQLARTQLRMGQPAKALGTLQPLIAGGDGNAQTHALAGEAHIQAGNLDQARASFEHAVKLDPSNSANLTQLALAKQKVVGIDATANALRKIAAEDKGTNADLALISLLLKNGQTDRALKAIDAVELKLPGNPLPANLRAEVHLLRKEAAAARASFEKAVAIDPVFVPAVAGLAALDVQDRNPAAARKRFEAVLKIDAKNLGALLALAKLRGVEGAPKSEIADLLAQAIRLNPGEATPRLLLIDLQLGEGDRKAALATAREAVSALPDQPDLVDALGRAEVASDATEQALATFGKLSTLEPKSTRPYMRLAAAQLTANNPAAAEQSLQRALALEPNFLEAQRALIKIALAGKRPEQAVAVARQVQGQRPNETDRKSVV